MGRHSRFTVDDGIYHVMVRGNNREDIFIDDDDFEYFLDMVKETKKRYEYKVYHYALMNNHVHMIITVHRKEDLSKIMRSINTMYPAYYRKKYGGIGHFFQDRYRSFIIQEGKYLLECGKYVELNPVKAGMAENPEEYKWSSYRKYIGQKNEIVDLDPEYEGLGEGEETRIKEYRRYVESGEKEKREEERFFREGAYGSKEFIEKLKKKGLKSVWSHDGRPKGKKKV